MKVYARAPCRISFGGGGTDVSPFVERYGGCVVSATIDRFMAAMIKVIPEPQITIRSNIRPEAVIYANARKLRIAARFGFVSAMIREVFDRDEGLEISLTAGVPAQSGLGGSGAMGLAVVAALNELRAGTKYPRQELAELAYRIETDAAGNPTGRQDQYAALYGGVNHIEFDANGVRRTALLQNHEGLKRRQLEDCLGLLWLGERHADSGEIIAEQSEAIDSDDAVVQAMLRTKALVPEMRDAVSAVDPKKIGAILHRLWAEKKRFHPRISNPEIDALYSDLCDAGMLGGKITGAGGGGHLLLCCLPERRDDVLERAGEHGIRAVPFHLTGGLRSFSAGLEVTPLDD